MTHAREKSADRPIATTTLEVARAIADAVLAANVKGRGRDRNGLRDRPTQAVFAALERTGCWFMRVGQAGDAITPDRALEEQRGVCRWCGCTAAAPCDDHGEPCRWVNAAQTLCSACAGVDRLIHTTRGRSELLSAFASLSARITTATTRAPYRRRKVRR